MVYLQITLPEDVKKEFKILAVKKEKDMSEIVAGWITKYVKRENRIKGKVQ